MFDENDIRISKGLDQEFELKEFNSEFVNFSEISSNLLYYKGVLYGFYNTMRIESEKKIEVQGSLIESFRGSHIGQQFLHKVIEIVSKENDDMEKIVAMIRYDNIISQKIAKKEHFEIDTELMEQLEEELNGLIPYSKSNEYYKNKKLV